MEFISQVAQLKAAQIKPAKLENVYVIKNERYDIMSRRYGFRNGKACYKTREAPFVKRIIF